MKTYYLTLKLWVENKPYYRLVEVAASSSREARQLGKDLLRPGETIAYVNPTKTPLPDEDIFGFS